MSPSLLISRPQRVPARPGKGLEMDSSSGQVRNLALLSWVFFCPKSRCDPRATGRLALAWEEPWVGCGAGLGVRDGRSTGTQCQGHGGPWAPGAPPCQLSALPELQPAPLSPAATWGGPLSRATFVSAPINTSQLPRSTRTAIQVEGAASGSPSNPGTHVPD